MYSKPLQQRALCDHHGLSRFKAQLFQDCSASCLCPPGTFIHVVLGIWHLGVTDSISCSLLLVSLVFHVSEVRALSTFPLLPNLRSHRSICSESRHGRPGRQEKDLFTLSSAAGGHQGACGHKDAEWLSEDLVRGQERRDDGGSDLDESPGFWLLVPPSGYRQPASVLL